MLLHRHMSQSPSIITFMTPDPPFLQPFLLHEILMTFWAGEYPLYIMHLFPIFHNQPLHKKEKISLPQDFFQLQLRLWSGERKRHDRSKDIFTLKSRAYTLPDSRLHLMMDIQASGLRDRSIFAVCGSWLAGKKLVMDSCQADLLDMSINLRRGNAGMAKHHLYRTKIGTMIQ